MGFFCPFCGGLAQPLRDLNRASGAALEFRKNGTGISARPDHFRSHEYVWEIIRGGLMRSMLRLVASLLSTRSIGSPLPKLARFAVRLAQHKTTQNYALTDTMLGLDGPERGFLLSECMR